MSSNLHQIRPLTAELAALECLKNQYFVLWSVLVTLASLFFSGFSSFLQVTRITTISRMRSKSRPDPTSDCGVSCPLVFEKSIFCVVATLASLFFSGSSSFLQVKRITTISRMSSNLGQIRPLTAELAAL